MYRDGIELPLISTPFSKLSLTPVINNDIVICSGDILEILIHIYEPPIKYWSNISKDQHMSENDHIIDGIHIIFEDDNLLVAYKSSGIPVHSTDGCYYNTLTEAIKRGLTIYKNTSTGLYPCHRLDKVTSGITILPKNKQMASGVQTKIESHNILVVMQENKVNFLDLFPQTIAN